MGTALIEACPLALMRYNIKEQKQHNIKALKRHNVLMLYHHSAIINPAMRIVKGILEYFGWEKHFLRTGRGGECPIREISIDIDHRQGYNETMKCSLE